MATQVEGTFELPDGHKVHTKSYLPAGTPKAKLIFIHGFSDHIGRYHNLFSHLSSRGIAIHAFDQRGWGKSVYKPFQKGLTGPTETVIDDIASFIKHHLASQPTTIPLFVLGHSMGGGEVLTLACSPKYENDVVKHVRGWLLEAPFIGFAKEETPSWIKIFAGRLAGKLLPHHQLVHALAPENLSSDPAIVKSIAEDELMHNTGTLEGFAGLLDRTTALTKGQVKPKGEAVKALWIGHGTLDKAVSYELSKNYFDLFTESVKDRQFKTYEGWFHQLHADGGRSEQFFGDVGDWILSRCEASDAPAATATATGTATGSKL